MPSANPTRLDAVAMARRAAGQIAPGAVVAIDAGLPAAAVSDAVPPERGVWFLRPSGMLNELPLAMSDAAAIARGGYVDIAIVNAAQVDAAGRFAGVAAASDFAAGAARIIAMLAHTDDSGMPNIVESLTGPAAGSANVIITDAAVIAVVDGGLTLTELATGWSADAVQSITGVPLSIAPDLREMDLAASGGMPVGKVYPDGQAALGDLPDGATVFIDGFGGPGGMAHYLLVALRDRGSRNLTIVSNTAGIARVVSFGTPPGRTAIDHSLLIENGQVAKAIASFPVSPSVSRPSQFELAYRRGEVELELVPQGTLAERLRAGGAGIPAFYTPTGAGTLIAEGKETRIIDGREYILEHGLRADYAIIRAHRADTDGNLVYRGTSRNFNAVMAPAARITVVEVDEIVPAGALDPEAVVTPGVFVQRIVQRPAGFTGYE